MLTLLSLTGPHGFDQCVSTPMGAPNDIYNLQNFMPQNYEPNPPANPYVNSQHLQLDDEMGNHWENGFNYPIPNQ